MADEEEEEAAEAVKVFIRVRPLNRRELDEKQVIAWEFNETSMIEETKNGQRLYQYDHVFGPTSTNTETYLIVGKPIVLKAMEGFNGTVFTYGQTGSGKTWTMRGCDSDPGTMFLCIRDIFEWKDNHPQYECSFRVSYLEVYNEEINDLLQQGAVNLRILSEDPVKGAVIEKLIEELVHTPQELLEVLQRGEANRSYGETKMNAESSRSHTIYRLVIEVNSVDVDENTGRKIIASQRSSYLNLVDLAGSERQKSTGASGKTLKEGANINKSLLALGAVINKLVEGANKPAGKAPFIPYRDSKLTRILKQSLGGNTYTSILCTCTGAGMHREETVSTLKFGQLCKSIKNSVKSNEVVDDRTLLKQLKATVATYKALLIDNGIPVDDKGVAAGVVGVGAVAGGGTGPSGDSAALIAKLKKEKSEQAAKLRALESMLSGGMGDMSAFMEGDDGVMGGDGDDDGDGGGGDGGGTPAVEAIPEIVHEDGTITPAVPAQPAIPAKNSMMSKFMSMQKIKDENHELADKIHFLEQEVTRLQTFADDAAYLEDSKQAFEEYQRSAQQELEEERTKVEKEKGTLSQDRGIMLIERGNLAEKESRLGSLMSTLDERESKLRQYMLTLKDQQDQWQRSVADLQRREDLVEDWARNHSAKEKKIEDLQHMHDRKMAALREREEVIISAEMQGKSVLKDIAEKEAKLQLAKDKLALNENALFAQEEKNIAVEAAFRKRETECDMKERELASRRREMESWDSLLREKDRKVSIEQRTLDDKEEAMREIEEKIRLREIELERKNIDLKQRETDVATQGNFYNSTLHTIELREAKSLEQSRKLRVWEEDLTSKDVELHAWEAELLEMQEKLADLSEREVNLEARIESFKAMEDEFYNVKVSEISARHTREIARLEGLVNEQLRAGENFQHELDKGKSEVARKTQELLDCEEVIKGKEELVEMLRSDLEQIKVTLATEKKQYKRHKRRMKKKTHHGRGKSKGKNSRGRGRGGGRGGTVSGEETTETEGEELRGNDGSGGRSRSSSDSRSSRSRSDSDSNSDSYSNDSDDYSNEEMEDQLLAHAAENGRGNSPMKGSGTELITGLGGDGGTNDTTGKSGSADATAAASGTGSGGSATANCANSTGNNSSADGTSNAVDGSVSNGTITGPTAAGAGNDGDAIITDPNHPDYLGMNSPAADNMNGEDSKEADMLKAKLEEEKTAREKQIEVEDSGENILDQPNVLLEAVAIQRILHRILKYHNAVPEWTPEYPAHHRERRSASDIYSDNTEYISTSMTTSSVIIQRENANRHWLHSGNSSSSSSNSSGGSEYGGDGEDGHGHRHEHGHGHRHGHGHSTSQGNHHHHQEEHAHVTQQHEQTTTTTTTTRTSSRKVNKALVDDYYKHNNNNSVSSSGAGTGSGNSSVGSGGVGGGTTPPGVSTGTGSGAGSVYGQGLTRASTGLSRTNTGGNMTMAMAAAAAAAATAVSSSSIATGSTGSGPINNNIGSGSKGAHSHSTADAHMSQLHFPYAHGYGSGQTQVQQHQQQHQVTAHTTHPAHPDRQGGQGGGVPTGELLHVSQFPGANHRRLPPGVHSGGGVVNMGLKPQPQGSRALPGYMGSPQRFQQPIRSSNKPAVPTQHKQRTATGSHKPPTRSPSMYSPNANVLIVHSNDTTNRTGAMKERLAQGEYTIDLSHDQIKKARVSGKFLSPKSNSSTSSNQ